MPKYRIQMISFKNIKAGNAYSVFMPGGDLTEEQLVLLEALTRAQRNKRKRCSLLR